MSDSVNLDIVWTLDNQEQKHVNHRISVSVLSRCLELTGALTFGMSFFFFFSLFFFSSEALLEYFCLCLLLMLKQAIADKAFRRLLGTSQNLCSLFEVVQSYSNRFLLILILKV